MKATVEQLLRLQHESGSIKKQEILRENKDNEDFRRLLYYALNPMLTYKISEQTLRTPGMYDPRITLTLCDIYEVCETLSKMKALDGATIYQVRGFLQYFAKDPELMEFYRKLLSKTLRLGVTAKTVNKVIPGLIPEWEVQQAYPIESHPIKEGAWFSLTQKLNGVRATYYKGELIARSGIPYEGLDHITSVLNFEDDSYVFDGELTLLDKGDLSDNEAFRVATGIINSDSPHKTQICYTIFDVVPTEEFEKGESSSSYRERRKVLDLMAAILPPSDHVSILPVLYSGTDQSQIWELLEQMIQEDKEGLVANLDTPYKRKRHGGILKVKEFYTMDLPIIGYTEGTGRLAGTLGALILDFKGHKVKVGSGFSNEQRAEFWRNRDNLIGVLCEVKYKEVSYDKSTGAESLQFPVFVGIRNDKEGVSYG